ncbi:unnamed protein product [Discula destructiva]
MPSLSKQSLDAANLSEKQADSLAKKRARDRRAQQNQRNKRNEQVRTLQEQLTLMESKMLDLSRECESLRRENQQLRGRKGSGSHLTTSRSNTSSPAAAKAATTHNPDVDQRSSRCAGVGKASLARSDLEFWAQWSGVTSSSEALLQYSKLPSGLTGTASWANTPAHSASDVVVTDSFKDWLQRPDLVLSSPEHPQPVELLYGSKTNFLADVINHSLRSWPCRDPERLATGWLIYYLIKWMLQPSPENYGRLQDFQVPVAEQLQHSHPYFIDFIFWPKLRANMILCGTQENSQDILGMFLCCVKLRWPWGQNFLAPEQDGTLKMRQDFFETFTSLDGWGLTDDFVHKFPTLAQGMDMGSLRYRIG